MQVYEPYLACPNHARRKRRPGIGTLPPLRIDAQCWASASPRTPKLASEAIPQPRSPARTPRSQRPKLQRAVCGVPRRRASPWISGNPSASAPAAIRYAASRREPARGRRTSHGDLRGTRVERHRPRSSATPCRASRPRLEGRQEAWYATPPQSRTRDGAVSRYMRMNRKTPGEICTLRRSVRTGDRRRRGPRSSNRTLVHRMRPSPCCWSYCGG